jgi:prevent-host-death family protein
MSKKPMAKLINALSVRTRLGEVMEEAEKENTRFVVSRRGKPAVVILGVEDYLRNIVKKDELLAEIQLGAQKAGLDQMTDEEIDAEIPSCRRNAKKTKQYPSPLCSRLVSIPTSWFQPSSNPEASRIVTVVHS